MRLRFREIFIYIVSLATVYFYTYYLSRYLILFKAKSTLAVVPRTVASSRTIKLNRMHSSRNIHRPNAIDVSGISVRVIKLGITAL